VAKLLRSRVVKYLEMPWYSHTKHVLKTTCCMYAVEI